MPIDPETGLGTHPLTAVDVIHAATGDDSLAYATDDWILVRCGGCGATRRLGDVPFRKSEDITHITEYVCPSGCGAFAATMYPTPIPMVPGTHYRLKNFVLWAPGMAISKP